MLYNSLSERPFMIRPETFQEEELGLSDEKNPTGQKEIGLISEIPAINIITSPIKEGALKVSSYRNIPRDPSALEYLAWEKGADFVLKPIPSQEYNAREDYEVLAGNGIHGKSVTVLETSKWEDIDWNPINFKFRIVECIRSINDEHPVVPNNRVPKIAILPFITR